MPAAAREGSISSAARPALACLGAPTPRPAPPAAPLPAAQPADRGAGPAPPAGGLGASSALTPARPRPRHPVGAVHGEHIMAIEGKWRPAAGGRRGTPRERGLGASRGPCPEGGERAEEAPGSRPRPGRRVGGAAPWVRWTLARARPAQIRRPRPVSPSGSGWPVQCGPPLPPGGAQRGSRAVLQTPRDGLGSSDRGGYPFPLTSLPANRPPAIPAFSPKWESSFAVPAPASPPRSWLWSWCWTARSTLRPFPFCLLLEGPGNWHGG